jgi:hypothetical protein
MRSIPNVDDERLQDSLVRIHTLVHTAEGLKVWDAPRRGLFDYGMKALAINAELRRRGVVPSVVGCRWCSRHVADESADTLQEGNR